MKSRSRKSHSRSLRTKNRRHKRPLRRLSSGVESLETKRLLAVSDFVINEFLADPASSVAAGDSNGDGTRDGSDDEFIELVNTGPAIDIGGWLISDGIGLRHTFPSPTNVGAGQAVVVFGGPSPTGTFGGVVVQTASTGALGLNNGGDTITLDDGADGTPVTVTYGSEGGNNQSLTLDPDLSGSFVEHSTTTGGLLFSPGFQSDGSTPFTAGGGGPITPTGGLGVTETGGSTELAEGGATDTIDVVLTGTATPTNDVTVTVTPADGEIDLGAGAGTSITLTFTSANANTPQSVTVTAVDDSDNEGSHSSSISFLSSSSDSLFDAKSSSVNVSIQDDDAATGTPVSIWLNEFHYDNAGTDIGEGIEIAGAAGTDVTGASLVLYNGNDGGEYQTIPLSGTIPNESGGIGTLNFVPSGSIQNGPDGIALINTDGTVIEFISYEGSFAATDGPAAGETSADVGVAESSATPVGESLQRPSNTAGSAWAGPNIASLGALNSVTATSFAIAVDSAAKSEGDSGSTAFTFTVTRSGDITGANDVDYTVASTTADAADFGGVSGDPLPSGTLNFASGGTQQTITINVSGDTDVEIDEAFTVTLSNATSGATIAMATANGEIQNDDSLLPSFSIAAASADLEEGDAGTTDFTFDVTRTGDTSVAESVDYAVTSTVADATDFGGTLPNGTVNFAANEAAVTLAIPVSGDRDFESDEDFTVTLSNASSSGTITIGIVSGTIQNDDVMALPPIDIWLNEFHYDNPNTDVGEAVEIAGAAGVDVSGASIVLYNGNGGTEYETIAISGIIDDEGEGFGALNFTPSGSIQNGGPDGIALVNADGTLIEFISYEGSFTATDGPAAGVTSTDVGVTEPGATGESIQREGNVKTGGWFGPFAASPGDLNAAPPPPPVTGPDFTISFAASIQPEGDSGVTPFTFFVSRSGGSGPTSIETIDYAVSGGTAAATDFADGVFPSGTIQFNSNQVNKQLTILVVGDTAGEMDETFTISLSNPSSGGTISVDSAQGTIQNDDVISTEPIAIWLNEFHYDNTGTDIAESVEIAGAAGLDVSGTSVVLYNGNGGTAYATVALSGQIDDEGTGVGALAFDISGAQNGPDGIALVNKDGSVIEFISYEGAFDATDGPAAGMTSIDVGVAEPGADGESLQRVNNMAGGVWSGPLTSSAGSLNSRPVLPNPTFAISASDASQPEGNADSTAFTFDVTRDGNTTGANTVDYTVSSSNANAADFGGTLPSGTVSFATGDTTQTIVVEVSADTVVEANEVFTVTLSNASSGGTISTATAEGTIENDDVVSAVPIRIWLNELHYDNINTDVGEMIEVAGPAGTDVAGASMVLYNGNGGTAYATIELAGVIPDEGADGGALSFDASGIQNGPDGIALVNTDGAVIELISYEGSFEATDGPAMGMTSVDIEVSEPGEIGESLQRLGNSAGGTWSGPLASSPGVLNSTPAVPAPSFDIAAVDAIKPEGDAGTTPFTFEVIRSGNTIGVNDVDFAVTSSLAVADDFGGSLPSGTVSFAAGDTTQTIVVEVSADSDVEPDETFTVTLSNPTGSATINIATAEGTIENDDAVIPDFAIAATDAVNAEGDSGTTAFTFEVTRTGDTTVADTIDFAVSSEVADADDFGGSLPSGIVRFAANETTQTISIEIAGDTDVESDELFTVTLDNPSNSGTISTATSESTIVNDDQSPSPPPPPPVTAIRVWLNEFHYDNAGTDEGEFVEIAGSVGTDVAGTSIVLYNGNGGTTYATIKLSGVIPDEGVGAGALAFDAPGIQNGAPDGIALINTDGNVIEFISYEGSFMATDGPADGMTSVNVGVTEPGDDGETIQRSTNDADGEWSLAAGSAGVLNSASTGPPVEPPEIETPPEIDPPVVDPPEAITDRIQLDKFLWDINGSPFLYHDLKAGDEFIYAFHVTNTGTTTLTNVVVTDPLPGLVMGDDASETYIAFEQPAATPALGNSGPFSSVERDLASDPFEAKAWDNFSFPTDTVIDGLGWTGAYFEPFAAGQNPKTDFLIEVFSDDRGKPEGIEHTFTVRGGDAGINDQDVESTLVTGSTADGGGPIYDYHAMLPFTYLNAGDYWVSVTALQTFPNASPTIDPTWQWHLGQSDESTEGDDFYSYDDTFDDAGDNRLGAVDGTPYPAILSAGKDLAFTWHASRLVEFNGSLAPGETIMFMGSYYLTQADIDAGLLVNQATATAAGANGTVSDVDEFAWTTVNAKLAISAFANGDDRAVVDAGSTVTWTYKVTNIGTESFTDIVVTGSTSESPKFDAASDTNDDGILSPGETWAYVATDTATTGLQENRSVVSGVTDSGLEATDTDFAFYTGELLQETVEVCNAESHADIDGNGIVGFTDFLQMRVNFGAANVSHSEGDLNCDGTVGFEDFLILAEEYGQRVDHHKGTNLSASAVDKVFEESVERTFASLPSP